MIGALVAAALGSSQPASGTTITGGTPDQRAMASWAVGRFAAEGLSLPPLEIRFHPTRDDCRERLGYYLNGVADICGTRTDRLAHRLILHEMSHGWAEFHLSREERDRFLDFRGLRTWNDHRVDWEERGFEHAAEIMSWALSDQGTGIHSPSIPDNSRDQLADGYQLLTGKPLPKLPPA
jgi:hypothetical protein